MLTLLIIGATVLGLLLQLHLAIGRRAAYLRGQEKVWHTVAWITVLVTAVLSVAAVVSAAYLLWIPAGVFFFAYLMALGGMSTAQRYNHYFGPGNKYEGEVARVDPRS